MMLAATAIGISLAITRGAGLVSLAAAGFVPQRTADGQPNIQGLWRHRAVGNATYDLEGGSTPAHVVLSAGCSQGIANCENEPVAGENMGRRPKVIVDPPGGKIPYQPWAAAKKDQLRHDHVNPRTMAEIDPQERCFLPGVPRMTYSEYASFQITQSPGYVMIAYEYTHAFRVIPIDGRPHPGDNIKLWMGDSRGRWEGNTLVVDTTNNNDQTWLDIVGTFHSNALHVVERFTIVDQNRMEYEATIEDPTVFTRPWKIAFPILRSADKAYEMMEMACVEGDQGVQHMLNRPLK